MLLSILILLTILQIQVQEVFGYMVQPIRVITIRGKPGMGKTEVSHQMTDLNVSIPQCDLRKLPRAESGAELLKFDGIAEGLTMGSW